MDESHADEPVGPLRPRFGKLTMIFGIIVALGLLVATLSGPRTTSGDTPTVSTLDPRAVPLGALAGQPAPDISFPLFDGSTFSIADHFANDGRPLVLNFWASWCIPCREEMPAFSELAAENPEIAFVGVAVDDARQSAVDFAEQVAVVYPLGIDESNTIGQSYPYLGLPTTYLIGADGIVARQIQGQVLKEQLAAYLDFDLG
jgi:cytochrome c biogenesis protein CcmG/thiol:disulfide interchange protein DsbE